MRKDKDLISTNYIASSYWIEPEYKIALNSDADIIILMLGTNDSLFNWNESSFTKDYNEMVESLMNIKSKPKL